MALAILGLPYCPQVALADSDIFGHLDQSIDKEPHTAVIHPSNMDNVESDQDALIDRFVLHVNSQLREPLWTEGWDDSPECEAPASIRHGDPDKFGHTDWRIKRFPSINWIEPFEQRLPFPFPPLYRSLITRYIFPAFCVPLPGQAGLQFLANTPEGTADHELRVRLYEDFYLTSPLFDHGFFYFANPTFGPMYDPICFDLNRTTASGDHPIVRFYHEDILIDEKVEIESELASSFEALLRSVLGDE